MLRDDGAVTVFAVIVLSSLLLFFSLLIDYARIAAVHKLSEDAVRSGVRSVLSAYDAVLYERYGLFGRGGTDGQSLFTQTLEANASNEPSLSGDGFKLAGMKVEGSSLHAAEYLGSHDVFARQVLEEMKYKAPVDFTLELAARFAPIAGAMKEAAATIGLLEQMRKLYEKREAHLAQAFRLQREAAANVGGSGMDALIPSGTSAVTAGGETVLAVASEYKAYAEQVMHDQSLPEGASPKFTQEIAAYEEKARSVTLALRRAGADMLKRHSNLMGDAVRELEAARQLNEEMQRLAAQANQAAPGGGYDTVARSRVPGADQDQVPAGAASELGQLKQSADELVLPDSWLAAYKQEMETQGADAAAVDAEAGSFQSNSTASMARPITDPVSETLLEGAANLRLAYGAYEEKYIRPATVLARRQQLLEGGEVKAKLKQQEEQAAALWTKARGMLQGLTSVPQMEEHTRLFMQVKKRYDGNMLFNQRSAEAASDEAGIGLAPSAHDAAEQSSAWMGGLFTGMADMLERTRDTVYFGEYVVHRFASFAPQNLRGMIGGGNPAELSHAISFNNQEAEYVIYGFHDSIGNIAAAYGELFGVRLAVRTMEGLIESRSLGHPLLILSAAILYGLEKAMEDMIAFTERGSAPLSKFVRAELTYTDYLRLFMLIRGSSPARMARMIAVIEQNSGTALSATPSGVTGEAEVSTELWFIPGLMGALGRLGLLEGKVVGNRYETSQTIGWSY
ncbi:hypothetical protein [Paenibacillus arenilitoris]|uniref:Uncharacterized protein n=1 Tax=Paenibacillus arenilitoris TaxID=2772299 RepID=A0A927CJB3_9BACL|nr:hypothetical protein [Paenibacillus arenilitoris]MBD2867772.1 hypothetical protein [Paenibacillus arenilitoris]